VTAEVQAPSEPTVLEFGRYRVFESPDGGWVIARAAATCDRCQSCGCGEQVDPIQVPAMVIAMAKQGGGLGKIKAGLKAVTGHGGTQ
jgi:hypothetical protein